MALFYFYLNASIKIKLVRFDYESNNQKWPIENFLSGTSYSPAEDFFEFFFLNRKSKKFHIALPSSIEFD